jgi:hypothetical protein
MGIICCFNCLKIIKKMDNRGGGSVNRQNQEIEFQTAKRLHRCYTEEEQKKNPYYNSPEVVFFPVSPEWSKTIYYSEAVYRGYCKNCWRDTNRLNEKEARFWFYFIHLKSDFGRKQKCGIGDFGVSKIIDYKSKKIEDTERQEAELDQELEDQGITRADLSQDTTVEQGNEDVAAWIRVEPGRNNALEIYTADELLDGNCPLCDYRFTYDEIKSKKLEGYDEFYQPKYIMKTVEEKWNEYIHQRFTNINKHFKEFHLPEYSSNSDERVPKQVNILTGMLQQLVIYENSLKMQHTLRTSSRYEKVEWRKEHNMKKLNDRYLEFSDKRAVVTRTLYKEYLLPTRMIAELLLDTDSNIRLKGFRGMLVNDDIPQWLLNVTGNIINNSNNGQS